MNRSVKEIAKSLGVNKNVIYRIIEKNGLEPVPESENGSKMYSDDDQAVIRRDVKSLQKKHQESGSKQPGGDNSPYMTMLEERVRQLESDLDQARDQIREKDKAILELTSKYIELSKELSIITKNEQILRVRDQEVTLAIESSHTETKFSLFRPSTWRKHSKTAETVTLTPVNESDDNESQFQETTPENAN